MFLGDIVPLTSPASFTALWTCSMLLLQVTHAGESFITALMGYMHCKIFSISWSLVLSHLTSHFQVSFASLSWQFPCISRLLVSRFSGQNLTVLFSFLFNFVSMCPLSHGCRMKGDASSAPSLHRVWGIMWWKMQTGSCSV